MAKKPIKKAPAKPAAKKASVPAKKAGTKVKSTVKAKPAAKSSVKKAPAKPARAAAGAKKAAPVKKAPAKPAKAAPKKAVKPAPASKTGASKKTSSKSAPAKTSGAKKAPAKAVKAKPAPAKKQAVSKAPAKAAPAKTAAKPVAPKAAAPVVKPATQNKTTPPNVKVNSPAVKSVVKPNVGMSVKNNKPEAKNGNDDQRSRYSDAELVEFKELINKKLEEATRDYELLKNTLSHKDDHGTDDTSPTFKLLEDGSDVLSKEETAHLAARQEKYIQNLKNALIRIQNKTYGICRVTGKLIPKERLRSVPHATLSIDAKLGQGR
jgi:RNA polymerase-binding transcription factor DksA